MDATLCGHHAVLDNKFEVLLTIIWKMRYFDMTHEHIGKQNSPHSSNELEVYNYVLYSFCPVFLVYFGHLSVICFLLFQLPLMLVIQY